MFAPNRYKKVKESEKTDLGMACPTPPLKKAKEVPYPHPIKKNVKFRDGMGWDWGWVMAFPLVSLLFWLPQTFPFILFIYLLIYLYFCFFIIFYFLVLIRCSVIVTVKWPRTIIVNAQCKQLVGRHRDGVWQASPKSILFLWENFYFLVC